MKMSVSILILSLMFSFTAIAQNSVPNGNFENWNTVSYENPQHFFSSNPEAYSRSLPFNCVKTTDAQQGTYAVQLTTETGGSDPSLGFFMNANPDNNFPNLPGGIAYTEEPSGIQGFYKSNIAAGDTGRVIVIFKKGGSNIALFAFSLFGVQNTYTSFSFSFGTLPDTPDTVIVGFTSSDPFNNLALAGSMLQVDNISFTGVTAQPTDLNGDFETWESNSITTPESWFTQSDHNTPSVLQTADVARGSFAIELKTYTGDRNGNPVANASQVGTGYNDCPNGGGQCVMRGGYPFSSMADTLAFYYKYIPSGNDSAQIYLNFKAGGVMIDGRQMNLGAAPSYTYMEIPFNLSSLPDSVIVQFQSSKWEDSSLTYVGSDLKIDEVHFKSQPLATGLQQINGSDKFSVFPNPSTDGSFILKGVNTDDNVRIYNPMGEEINFSITRLNNASSILLPSTASGVYFIQVLSKEKSLIEKILVNRK